MNLKTFAATVALAFPLLVSGVSGANAATQFDFSYSFHNDLLIPTGDVISGSFFGDLSGSTVTNITGITASFDGHALAGPLNAYSYTGTGPGNCPTCFTSGGAVASFDGLANNFVFADAPIASASNYFYIIQPWNNPGLGSTSIAVQFNSVPLNTAIEPYNGDYVPASFVLTAVPEPATWALFLLGFGAIGWTLRGRRLSTLAPNV